MLLAVQTDKHEFRYFSTFILHQKTAARMIDGDAALTYEHRSPAGVFALISPWNMPLYLLTVGVLSLRFLHEQMLMESIVEDRPMFGLWVHSGRETK
jgi:hypothetical protein